MNSRLSLLLAGAALALSAGPAAAATTQTQIPVPAGAHLGVDVVGPEPLFNAGNAADQFGAFTVNAPIGAINNVTAFGGLRVNIAAVLEPDADHDGYGDETQDGCPSDAAQQLPCAPGTTPTPAPPTPATPATQAGQLVSLVTPGRESIKSGYVTVSAMSAGQVTVSASGRIGAYKLASASRSLAPGSRTTLKLKIPKKALRAIRVRLAHHRKVTAKVTVMVGATTTPVKVRLVR